MAMLVHKQVQHDSLSNTSIAAGPEKGGLVHRGSLEVGDVLSDLSANPMELSLLGVQGQCLTVAHRVFCISVIHL